LQRTRLLLHVVDIAPPDPEADPVKDARAIVAELRKYDVALHAKPRWLVLNKLDLLPEDGREARAKAFAKAFRWKGPVFSVAAISGEGCRPLVYAIQAWLDAHPAEPAEAVGPAETPVVVTPAPIAPRRRRAAKNRDNEP